MARWTTTDSEELYQVPAWGQGWFSVNEKGNLVMRPPEAKGGGVDLKVLVDDLRRRGIAMPVLIRFSDLVRARIETLVGAFTKAIREYEYQGRFRGVYPIKVNQDFHVVGDFVRYAAPHHLGLEAGSKPELQVVLAMLEDPEALIICNGYKDRDYIQMAMLARKLGRNCIIVVEQADELEVIKDVARELELKPVIGIRAKLTTKGSGRWQSSVGDRAKFGLTVREIVDMVHHLREAEMLDCLQLLHFHIGSQVTNIRSFHTALREACRIYTELVRMGAAMKYVDCGGGLGVDYDGSRTNFESSMNYTPDEYAAAIVATLVDACDQAKIPHPDIITEAGRAMIAHHAALLFDVVGVTHMVDDSRKAVRPPKEDACEELQELHGVYKSITGKNLLEPLHDAGDIREQSLLKFNLGLISLEERAEIDALYFAICRKLYKTADRSAELPEEIEPLEKALADIYYCNFSLFQSAPDSWAIGQLFPILPIHKLDEEPDRRCVLADLTCDSDGKIERFIDKRDVKSTLEVHDPEGKPYYLGMFLVGAYQEILGDLHNLFGDTNVVHVAVAEGRAGYKIEAVVEGNVVREVLEYVSYDRNRLVKRLRTWVEEAIEDGRLTPEEGGLLVNAYLRGLESYTYLS